MINGRLLGEDVSLDAVAPLFHASRTDLSFVIWPKDIRLAKTSKACCVIALTEVIADHADQFPMSLIATDSLDEAFVILKNLVDKGYVTASSNSVTEKSIALDAIVHPSANIGRAHVGRRSIIGPQVVVHDAVVIGDDCAIGAGSVLGSSPFVPFGVNPSRMLPALGSVRILNNVRIGALCTIDRGLLGQTRIDEYSLLDNQVHVGHDTHLGKNVVCAAQSGFAGFVRIGDDVTIGGQVGIVPHAIIGNGARISGKSMVHCDIKAHEIWSGNPSLPHAIYLRAYGELKRKFAKAGRRK